MNNHARQIAKAIYLLYIGWLLLHLISNIIEIGSDLDYSGWGLSDMLINYQGGFVRRGLLGELLYQLYEVCPFNVSSCLLILILGSAIGCFSILLYICHRLSYSPVLILSGFTLQFMALVEVVGVRRDYLNLLLCLLSFWTYRKWLHKSSISLYWLFLCQSTMILSVLLHEGAWFYTTPLLCLHLLMWNKKQLQKSWIESGVRSFAFISPIAIVMVLLFVHKGNMTIAQSIWQSWQPLFSQFPLQGTQTPDLGLSVMCLNCSTMDFITGCGVSLWGLTYWGWLPMFPLTLALFPVLIYLVSCANYSGISMGYPLRTINKSLMTSIMMLQLCFMSPFFLFLSCDYGRLFCYWIISSVFAYYIFKEDICCVPTIMHGISERFQDWIAKSRFFCSPLGYITVLVLTPCNMVGGAALGAIPFYRMVHETRTLLMELLF